MKGNSKRIVIIAISYQSDEEVLQFVTNISEMADDKFIDLIIVDNTERLDSDKLFQQINELYPLATCLKPKNNLGYFGGANFAYKEVIQEGNVDFEWLVVSNVDVRFSDKNFFKELRRINYIDKNIGILAPAIISEKSWRDLNPRLSRRPKSNTMHTYKYIFSNVVFVNIYEIIAKIKYYLKNKIHLSTIIKKLFCIHYHQQENKQDLIDIYAPHGSCILFSKEYFTKGGKLDYPMFLFGEEIFVAETARKIGVKVVYCNKFRARHNDHCSTGILRTRKMTSFVHESAIYIANSFF